MFLPFSAIFNPMLQKFNLLRAKRTFRMSGRHSVFGIFSRDPLIKGTIQRFTGNNGRGTIPLSKGTFFDIQSQISLKFLFVRTVTGIAMIGQQRLDLALKIHRLAKRNIHAPSQAKRQTQPTGKKRIHSGGKLPCFSPDENANLRRTAPIAPGLAKPREKE